MLSVRIFYLLLLLMLNLPAIAEPVPLEPTEDDLIIVELQLEQQLLSDSLFVYSLDPQLFLPLEELASLLSFSLTVDAEKRTADGWFITPERTFSLDLASRTVMIAGIKHDLPKSNGIIKRNGDLYVPQPLLEQWFPIHLALNFSDMRLTLSSDEPLPLQQKLKRQKSRRLPSGHLPDNTPIRYREDRYHWASYPTLDLTLDSAFDGTDSTNTLTTSLSASGDLLKHAAFLSYNYNDQTSSPNIRFNLSRYASTPDQRLPGGLFSYQLGDLSLPGDSLISSGGNGVGVALTSSTTQQSTRYTSTVIEGDAPPDWEAELYRNGSLLTFQTTSSDGIYRFEDVELWYGSNNFEVRLFGPQGQTRIERSSSYIGNSLLLPGNYSYAFYAIDEKNNRLFGEQTAIKDPRINSDIRAEWNYGLTNNWSIGAAWNHLDRTENDQSTEHNYLSLSSDLSLSNAFIQTAFSHDSEGGNAALLSLRSTLGNQSISLQHRYFDDFISEKNSTSSPLRYDTQLRLNGHLKTDRFISYGLAAKQEVLLNAADRYELSGRLSTQLAGINLTQSQTLNKKSGTAGVNLPGSLSASRSTSHGGISAVLNYNLNNDGALLNSVSGSLRNKINSRQHNLLRLSYSPGSNDSWSLQDNFTWKLDQANLTLRASTDDKNAWRVGAAINFSTGFDDVRQRPWLSAQSSSKSSTLNTRVFLDKDNSGTFSTGDQPLTGISLTGSGINSDLQTNSTGKLQLRNLPTFRPVTLGIDDSTLEDPFWQLRESPAPIYMHTGARAELELPVIAVSEVEGRMFTGDNDGQYPIKSTRMLLVNEQGEKIATAWSEFDGMFLFENVPPGKYRVQADRELLNKKGLSRPTSQPVIATMDGGVINIGTTVLYSRSVVHAAPARSTPTAAVAVSTIRGRIFAGNSNGQQPIASVRMLLTNTQSAVVASTASGSDGEFLFEGVVPGSYHVKTDDNSLNETDLSIPSPQSVIAPAHSTDVNIGTTVLYSKSVVSAASTQQRSSAGKNKPEQLSPSDKPDKPLRIEQQWLNAQPANHYAVQLMAGYQAHSLKNFTERHNLKNTRYYRTRKHNRDWFVLLQGIYPDRQQALSAASQLSATMRKNKPWIRSVRSIQKQFTGPSGNG